MTTPDAGNDSIATHVRRARTWRALALVLGAIVILETAVLLQEFSRTPEPAPPVATAAADVVVPDLVGVPEPEARRLLSEAGLVAGARTETAAPLVDDGAVASQDPVAGERVPRGTPVSYAVATIASPSPSLAVTSPPSPVVGTPEPPVGRIRVGDYRCMVLPEAEAHIRDDGFEVGRVSYSIEGGPVDDTWAVTRQDPQANSSAAPGATIDILLSSPFGVCAREGS